MKTRRIFAATLLLLSSAQVFCAPSQKIAEMINTPVSAFDFLIFSIYTQNKCSVNWYKTDAHDPCITSVSYDPEENVISFNFFISNRSHKMKNFYGSTDDGKELILVNLLDKAAALLGVTPHEDLGFRWGMIDSTKIRNGYEMTDFDERAAKAEFASRSVVVIRTRHNGFVYHAKRDLDGDISFGKRPTPEEVSDLDDAPEQQEKWPWPWILGSLFLSTALFGLGVFFSNIRRPQQLQQRDAEKPARLQERHESAADAAAPCTPDRSE